MSPAACQRQNSPPCCGVRLNLPRTQDDPITDRWGSAAVRVYVRAAPPENAARQAAAAARRHHDLEYVVVDAAAGLAPPGGRPSKLAEETPVRWRN